MLPKATTARPIGAGPDSALAAREVARRRSSKGLTDLGILDCARGLVDNLGEGAGRQLRGPRRSSRLLLYGALEEDETSRCEGAGGISKAQEDLSAHPPDRLAPGSVRQLHPQALSVETEHPGPPSHLRTHHPGPEGGKQSEPTLLAGPEQLTGERAQGIQHGAAIIPETPF